MKDMITKAINCYLGLDPESKQRMQKMQDKIVEIELLSINLKFQINFKKQKAEVKFSHLEPAHTYIRGTPLRLLHLAFTTDNRKQFFSDDISIEGDLDFAQQVIDLFDHLEIDWEEYASQWIGDVLAHQIGGVTQKIKKFTNHLNKTLLQDINEYVHEEVDLFPTREELDDFFNEIDVLRMDADRLEAKIAKIRGAL